MKSGLGQEISALSHEFWDEEGYEEGEYWRERDEKRSFYFRVNQEGNYAISLYLETSPNLTSVPVTVSLYERSVASTPLCWFGGISLVLGFLGWFTAIGGWQWIAKHTSDEDE